MMLINEVLRASLLIVIFFGVTGCSALKKNDDGSVVAETEVDIPLIPFNFPLFPTALTLTSLEPSIKSVLQQAVDLQPFKIISMPADAKIKDAIEQLNKKLSDATREILQPSTLSVSIEDRIEALEKVRVTDARFSVELTNNTKDFAAMPASFALFMGDKEQVDALAEEVRIPFEIASSVEWQPLDELAPLEEQAPQITVKPNSESVSAESGSLPEFATYLTSLLHGESNDFSVNYTMDYSIADTENGADPTTFVKKLGKCIAALSGLSIPLIYETDASKDCPPAKDLASWHVGVANLTMTLKVEAELFNVDEIPTCDEFATTHNLDILNEVCGES